MVVRLLTWPQMLWDEAPLFPGPPDTAWPGHVCGNVWEHLHWKHGREPPTSLANLVSAPPRRGCMDTKGFMGKTPAL